MGRKETKVATKDYINMFIGQWKDGKKRVSNLA